MPENSNHSDLFKGAPEGTSAAIIDLMDKCELEDQSTRSYQIALWKRNENYWEGVQNIFWSENLSDWISIGENGVSTGQGGGEDTADDSGPLYDYVINIYRSHGESIVAALSQSVPYWEAFPDDTDNPNDISTAKSRTKLALIIQRHNKAKLRIMEILFKFFNQGLCIIHRYRDRDEKYGTVKVPKFDKVKVTKQSYDCPDCGASVYDALDGEELVSNPRCEKCNKDAVLGEKEETTQTQEVGKVDLPKAKETWDIYGPLNFKIPYYARNQKECGYAIKYYDENVAKTWNDYPDFRDVITADAANSKERWSRTPSSYITSWMGTGEDTNLCNIKCCWFRPWQLELIAGNKDDDDKMVIVEWLKKKYKTGLYVKVICKNVVEVYDTTMDKDLIIRKSSLSSYIHALPVGQPLVAIQEMVNQLANLTIETIEYGIPALFADSAYLDFDTFGQQQSSPGMVTPAKAPAGHNLPEGFFEQKLATPSKEIEIFRNRLDDDAQFVSGDYPSIYGGPSEGKSRTLGEYVQSGKRALARLSITFEHLRELWNDLNTLSVNEHADEMRTFQYDEKMTQKDGQGFKTIKAMFKDLNSGSSYAECSENFPVSSDQKMALLMQLLQVPTPEIMAVLAHPENSKVITQALAFPELYIPGEAQRFKALWAVNILLKSEPQEVPDPSDLTGQSMVEIPTIEPEEGIDDGPLQAEVINVWLNDERGMTERFNNPAGYANVKAYKKALEGMVAAQTQQANATPAGVPPATDLASVQQ